MQSCGETVVIRCVHISMSMGTMESPKCGPELSVCATLALQPSTIPPKPIFPLRRCDIN